MSWLGNPSMDDDSEESVVPPANDTNVSTRQHSLHALRALGIFFIQGAIAALVGFGIAGVGYLVLLAGAAAGNGGIVTLGGIVVGIGAVAGFVGQIVVVVAANAELRKSGVSSPFATSSQNHPPV
jgi:hypothetical protein